MNLKQKLLPLIAYGISLAMGVASIVLNILGEPVDVMLTSIAITVLGFVGLLTIDKE